MSKIKIKYGKKCYNWWTPTADLSKLQDLVVTKILLNQESYELHYLHAGNTIVITDNEDLEHAIKSKVDYIFVIEEEEECKQENTAMDQIESDSIWGKQEHVNENSDNYLWWKLDCKPTTTELEKLNKYGCVCIEDLVFDIANINIKFEQDNNFWFTEERFQKIYYSARKYILQSCINNNNINKAKIKKAIHISTGCPILDKGMNGGIRSSVITEVRGDHRTGKTTLCLQLSCLAQRPEKYSGGGGAVLFWDTQSAFRQKRISDICVKNGMNPDDVLNNISYTRSHDPQFIQTIAKLFAYTDYSLLVIDSISGLFKITKNNRKQEENKLCAFIYNLTQICYYYNTAVVVTSQKPNSKDKNDIYSYKRMDFNFVPAKWQIIHMRKDETVKNKTHFHLTGNIYNPKESCLCITSKGIEDWIDHSQ